MNWRGDARDGRQRQHGNVPCVLRSNLFLANGSSLLQALADSFTVENDRQPSGLSMAKSSQMLSQSELGGPVSFCCPIHRRPRLRPSQAAAFRLAESA